MSLLEGSLAGLRAIETHTAALAAGRADTPRLAALDAHEARVLYARAVGRPLENRALSKAAKSEYRRVAQLADRALRAMTRPSVLSTPGSRVELALRKAWSLHRLFDFEAAEGAYRNVWRRGRTPGDRARTLALRGLKSLYGIDPNNWMPHSQHS